MIWAYYTPQPRISLGVSARYDGKLRSLSSLDCNTVSNRRAEWTNDAVTDAMCQVCICWYRMTVRDVM
jgi:hypothetical protein